MAACEYVNKYTYSVGDKVEVVKLEGRNAVLNIKVGDVAKVTLAVNCLQGGQYIECRNPEWGHEGAGGDRNMLSHQIKKVSQC